MFKSQKLCIKNGFKNGNIFNPILKSHKTITSEMCKFFYIPWAIIVKVKTFIKKMSDE